MGLKLASYNSRRAPSCAFVEHTLFSLETLSCTISAKVMRCHFQVPGGKTKLSIKAKDQALIQIVDSALAEATRRSGSWLVCRPGCTQCCIGAFPINQLDALRLRRGLAKLKLRAPQRAESIRERARDAVARLSRDFPGDPVSGVLDEGDEAAERFSEFANDEPCPVLDPATGNCELYESRPMACRVFGPPVRCEDGLGVCELCYQGASDEEIAACEMKPDPDDLESALLKALEDSTGTRGDTIIAFCLAS
jgi:Fe-S-cluster containining protein